MKGPSRRNGGPVVFMVFYELIKKFLVHEKLRLNLLTVKGLEMDLRHLCLYLRNPEFETITDDDILGYLQGMVDLGYTANGVYKKAITYRQFWRWSNRKGIRTFNWELIPYRKAPPRIPNPATEEDYRKIMAILDKQIKRQASGMAIFAHIRDRAVISLLWDTGARVGEICDLELDQLQSKKAVIRTEKSRGQRPFREIFWTKKTEDYLTFYLSVRKTLIANGAPCVDEKALFLSNNVNAGVLQKVSNHTIATNMRVYSKKAKIRTFNPHRARHHMAHDIIHKGGSNTDVMNILGHSKLESSRFYTQMYDKELEKRYRRFKGK